MPYIPCAIIIASPGVCANPSSIMRFALCWIGSIKNIFNNALYGSFSIAWMIVLFGADNNVWLLKVCGIILFKYCINVFIPMPEINVCADGIMLCPITLVMLGLVPPENNDVVDNGTEFDDGASLFFKMLGMLNNFDIEFLNSEFWLFWNGFTGGDTVDGGKIIGDC